MVPGRIYLFLSLFLSPEVWCSPAFLPSVSLSTLTQSYVFNYYLQWFTPKFMSPVQFCSCNFSGNTSAWKFHKNLHFITSNFFPFLLSLPNIRCPVYILHFSKYFTVAKLSNLGLRLDVFIQSISQLFQLYFLNITQFYLSLLCYPPIQVTIISVSQQCSFNWLCIYSRYSPSVCMFFAESIIKQAIF